MKYTTRKEGSLLRIIAAKSFESRYGKVQENEEGGLISSEENLSQKGNCWINFDASATEQSRVQDDAFIGGSAKIRGNAIAKDSSSLIGEAVLEGDARIEEESVVRDKVSVGGRTCVRGKVVLKDEVQAYGDMSFAGKLVISGNGLLTNS